MIPLLIGVILVLLWLVGALLYDSRARHLSQSCFQRAAPFNVCAHCAHRLIPILSSVANEEDD